MAKKPAVTKIEIPAPLIEAVKSRRAIPFFGAGASKEARDTIGRRPPDADQLRDILATRFFNREIKNRSVMAVAEMAIQSSGGQSHVFEVVRQALDSFEPSDAHRLVSEFNWRMLATTNYDLLLERAYAQSQQRRQHLVRFVKDDEPIEEKLQAVTNPLPYLKLHGCLDHLHDSDIPLVLSSEHYSTYLANRTRLFGRLKDLARESTMIFVGYRLDDQHVRELIYALSSDKRPRWYIVTPDAEDYDIDFWATKNVGVLKCRFHEFMTALDVAVPPLFRSLAPSDAVTDFPIRRFYSVQYLETEKVRAALETDLTLVHSGIPFADQSAMKFYEGYDTGWGGIVRRLDVRRKIENDLLYKSLLENDNPGGPVLIMLRGAAGAGKTIALKRTAFEAATASNALVLWLEESGALNPNVFFELHELCQRPLYLFVDQVALQIDKLHRLLKAAKARSIPLVVIGAERDSDWNTYCSALEMDFTPQFVRVGNLSRDEVEGLLDLLERHDCLGLLKAKTRAEQINSFMEKERADRQLLVALHELTQGKPFEEIVLNEHQRVYPEQARQLYLDIATMHQFSVKVRAGTISRISGINFDDYKANFFAPLQDIVRIERDNYSGDFCYRTRHSRVAEIVFRQVCPDDATKARQMKRLIEGLDVGYSSDRRAIEEMTRGRTLADAFGGSVDARTIYEAAVKAAPKQAFIYQQWAIFESAHGDGSLLEAERQVAIAHELDPRSKSIVHTQAEIDRKRANDESSALLKGSLRRRARARLDDMPINERFAVSSRCKILVDELEELNSALTDDAKPHETLYFAEKVKDTESALLRAQQLHPDDPDIIQIEARFRQEMEQEDKALRALERAWAAGPRGSGTAIRIARMYDARRRPDDALKMLKDALARSPDDKFAHQAIAFHHLGSGLID
ncbi:MAG: SIR2 family protein [Methylocella sp.]